MKLSSDNSQSVVLCTEQELILQAIASALGALPSKAYSAAHSAALAAAATDVFTLVGSASKTIYVTSLRLSGLQTTAGLAEILLIKRSAANTTGTVTAATAVPHDSADAAGTAVLNAYTVNPGALGAAVGAIRRFLLPVGAAAAPLPSVLEIKFERPIVLRGVAECLAVNLNAATLVGGVLKADAQWYEV